MVLHRRARESQAPPRPQRDDCAPGLGAFGLHRLSLVQDQPGELAFREERKIVPQGGVARQDHETGVGALIGKPLPALGAVVHEDAELRREAGKLRPPVEQEGARHHDLDGTLEGVRASPPEAERGDGLDGLA